MDSKRLPSQLKAAHRQQVSFAVRITPEAFKSERLNLSKHGDWNHRGLFSYPFAVIPVLMQDQIAYRAWPS
jgi:hypothetical protein